jgi:hypothetical protein
MPAAGQTNLGFGSVHIQFDTPTGYLQGFRDYLNYLAAAEAGNQTGPITYVGNYGSTSNNSVTFVRLTNDINENGVPGAVIIVDPVTGRLTTMTDFGDLHTFNIGFDEVSLGQIPHSGAIDVINVVWLGDDQTEERNAHTLASWQPAEALRFSDWQAAGVEDGATSSDAEPKAEDPNLAPKFSPEFVGKKKNGVGLIYGVRMIEREDFESLRGTGGIFGSVRSETVAANHVMGPAVGLVWIRTRGRWSARLQGLVSVGFNSGSVEQNNLLGDSLVPGAINRPLYAQPIASAHHDSFDEFSPSGELSAGASYRISQSITFAVNWSGITIENALEATNRRRDFLPDFGLVDPGNQNLFVNNFFCGIEITR